MRRNATTPGQQKQWKRGLHRGTVAVEIKGGCEGYGDICLWWQKWDSGGGGGGGGGGGDFLSRISVYKGEEGRLSET
eukprot:scaffold5849_cov63-Attheya_sp.AAC.2